MSLVKRKIFTRKGFLDHVIELGGNCYTTVAEACVLSVLAF